MYQDGNFTTSSYLQFLSRTHYKSQILFYVMKDTVGDIKQLLLSYEFSEITLVPCFV